MNEILEQLEHGPQTLEQIAHGVGRPPDEVQGDLIRLAARKQVFWEIDDTFWLATPGMPEQTTENAA